MSLIVYECGRPEHGHELRQWDSILSSLQEYFEGREELALLIINFNVGNVELDGLLIKDDAIIILELKDRSGTVCAKMNGDWTCDDDKNNPVIHGGSGKKTVFEQIRLNRKEVRDVFLENNYFSKIQLSDIQGLIVFTRLDAVKDDFDRNVKAWLHLSDVKKIGEKMHSRTSRKQNDWLQKKQISIEFTQKDKLKFIEQKLSERNLITKYSDVHLLPPHLFDASRPHNGKLFNVATEWKNAQDELKNTQDALQKEQHINTELQRIIENQENKQKEIDTLKEQIFELQKKLENTAENKNELMTTINTLSANVEELQEQLSAYKDSSPQMPPEENAELLPDKPTKDFDVNEENMDDDQLDLIDKTLDKSMLVTGPAGCGKSLIALHKATQIAELGRDVIFISFTKTLTDYIHSGYEAFSRFRCYYHHEWLKSCPQADYLVVDEIRDFTKNEIEQFINAAKKNFFFFGDSAQSIFSFKKCISMEELSEWTGLPLLRLYNNYRLPKTVAKITQEYVGVHVQPYSEKIYKSNEKALPSIIQYANEDLELQGLIKLLEKHNHIGIGILASSNEEVFNLSHKLKEKRISCEYKCQFDLKDQRNNNSVTFYNTKTKIMTFHCAKGLQFETVIISNYNGADTDGKKRELYVAMTRTYKNLYILYHTEQLKYPLSEVPTHLYLKGK